MKKNRLYACTGKRSGSLAALLVLVLVLGAIVGLVFACGELHDLWREQCRITDFARQVSITDGETVKAETIAWEFGLNDGANLAAIDFGKKRLETLEKYANIRELTVTRHLPDRVTIEVEERQPVARLSFTNSRESTGKVVDDEGKVFIRRRNTALLPIIRENRTDGTECGQCVRNRTRAALRLLRICRDAEFQDLNIVEVDVSKPDYLLATMGDTYARAKIAWAGMDETSPESDANLRRQLWNLLKSVQSDFGAQVRLWNATDVSNHSRIYADTKGRP